MCKDIGCFVGERFSRFFGFQKGTGAATEGRDGRGVQDEERCKPI